MILGFMKKCFFTAMTHFNFNLSNGNSLECVLKNNQECKTRPEIINHDTNESQFYPYSIKTSKCKGIAIESIIHMLQRMFLTILKIQMSKVFIAYNNK